MKTNYRGIDYSGPSGTCNRDIDLGIRYGVISQLIVLQAWSDSSEPDYGAPHCHYCGNECFDSGHCDTPDFDDPENADIEVSGCGEYYCDTCRKAFDGEYAYGDPIGYVLDDGEYKASCGDDGDIFVIRSPFYTHAQFCSPCAPGAGHLGNPCPDGPKTFCFGHDWFEGDIAPYPVYSVKTGELVLPDLAGDFDAFWNGYLLGLAFTASQYDTPEQSLGGNPDSLYHNPGGQIADVVDVDEFSKLLGDATVLELLGDCVAFYRDALPLLGDPDEFDRWDDLGFEFHLTRNSHGAGFWDGRGYLGRDGQDIDRELTELSKPYGTCELEVCGDRDDADNYHIHN